MKFQSINCENTNLLYWKRNQAVQKQMPWKHGTMLVSIACKNCSCKLPSSLPLYVIVTNYIFVYCIPINIYNYRFMHLSFKPHKNSCKPIFIYLPLPVFLGKHLLLKTGHLEYYNAVTLEITFSSLPTVYCCFFRAAIVHF